MIDIDNEIKNAILNKDHTKVEVYRAIKNEILKFNTQKNAPKYTDEIEIRLLNKMAKSHEESILAYKEANRNDLIEQEEKELNIIYSLLPKPVDESIIKNEISLYSDEKGYSIDDFGEPIIPRKEMGIIIKYLKSTFPVNDGKEISDIVKKYIV